MILTASITDDGGDEPERDGRPNRTYISWDEAAARGEMFALEWIDREEEEKR
jgi:hypothetical protein